MAGRLHTRYKQPEPFRRVSCALLARALTEGGVDVLLLDLRPVEEYVACHIRSARCYPSRLLYRAVNEFDAAICACAFWSGSIGEQMLSFSRFRLMRHLADRNREDILRCIVIYDEDERVAIAAGNLFVEKGVENIRVLTGGLREFSKRFPALVQRADDYNNWSTGPVAVPQVPQPQIARRTATAASPSRPVRPVSCAALSESRSRVSLPEHRWRV